jgi:hypothetical protein
MFIPDPKFFPSRIQGHNDSGSAKKNLSNFNPQLFLSYRKYDPGCSFRIRIPDPDLDFLPIPDPGSISKIGTGSRIPDPVPKHCLQLRKCIYNFVPQFLPCVLISTVPATLVA